MLSLMTITRGGSPIIQDGKLVGAVTHVPVNDPMRGHGTRPALYTAPSTFGSPHGRLGPQPVRQLTGLSHCGCALTGPSPIFRTENRKKTYLARQVFFYWRRTWDSNPRGVAALLDFQSSSLATRSILHAKLMF